jgi:hypothetical protein
MMLDAQVLQAPLLDHSELDLDAARHLTYVIEQSFRYDYDAPVKSLRQRLVIIPPARHGSQYLRRHVLEVTGARARRWLRRDAHGNLVAWVRSEHVTQAVEFRLVAVVERVRDHGPAVLDAGALRDPRLLRPTRLTAPWPRTWPATWPRIPGPRSSGQSGSALRSIPRSATPTASPRCGPRPPRPWPSAAGYARTSRT